MTNKLEISRELAERFAHGRFDWSHVAELRALLAAEPSNKCGRCGASTVEGCNYLGCYFLESGNGESVKSDPDDRHAAVKAIHDIMQAVPCSSLYSLAEAVLDAGYAAPVVERQEPAYWEYQGTSLGNQIEDRLLDHLWLKPNAAHEHDYIKGVPLYREQPAPVAVDIESAAKKLAGCMDYPWEHMPEQGRDSMREHAKAIISAACLDKVKELNQ